MADELSIKMTGDAATLAREIEKLNDKIAKQKDELKALQDGYKKAGDEGEKAEDRVAKATDAAAKATWEQNRAIQQVKQGWKEQADAAEKVQESMSPESIAAYATAFVGGFASIQKAIQLVNTELRTKIELQAKAKETHLSAEGARAELIQNLPGSWTIEQKKQFLAESNKIASERGIPIEQVDSALSQTISATGGNAKAAINAANTAAKYMAAQPAKFNLFAGSMADLQSVTGTDDSEVGLGLLKEVGVMSRTVKAEQKATSIPKALSGMKAFGATMQESSALFGALSTATKDAMGDQTKTATIQLAKQLEDFLPLAGRTEQRIGGLTDLDRDQRKTDEKALAKALARKATGATLTTEQIAVIKRDEDLKKKEAEAYTIPSAPALGSMGARISYLQQNPAEAKRFIETGKGEGAWKGMTLEAGAIGQARQLFLDPNSEAARLYKQNLASLPDVAGLKASGAQAIKDLDIDPSRMIGETKRTFSTGTQSIELADTNAAMASVVREGMKDISLVTKGSAIGEKFDNLEYELKTNLGRDGALPFAVKKLGEFKSDVMSPVDKSYPTYSAGMGPAAPIETPRAPNETELKIAAALERMIVKLEEIKQSNEKNVPPTLSPPDRDR